MKINFDKIEEIRKAKGISKSEMLRQIGIGRTTYHFWNTGERVPSLSKIMILCKWLGVEISEIIK